MVLDYFPSDSLPFRELLLQHSPTFYDCARWLKAIWVCFENRTSLENGADWIELRKNPGRDDGETWCEQLTGGLRGSAKKYPGLDGRPNLKINADHFEIVFKSDYADEDWGFLVCAFPEFATAAHRVHNKALKEEEGPEGPNGATKIHYMAKGDDSWDEFLPAEIECYHASDGTYDVKFVEEEKEKEPGERKKEKEKKQGDVFAYGVPRHLIVTEYENQMAEGIQKKKGRFDDGEGKSDEQKEKEMRIALHSRYIPLVLRKWRHLDIFEGRVVRRRDAPQPPPPRPDCSGNDSVTSAADGADQAPKLAADGKIARTLTLDIKGQKAAEEYDHAGLSWGAGDVVESVKRGSPAHAKGVSPGWKLVENLRDSATTARKELAKTILEELSEEAADGDDDDDDDDDDGGGDVDDVGGNVLAKRAADALRPLVEQAGKRAAARVGELSPAQLAAPSFALFHAVVLAVSDVTGFGSTTFFDPTDRALDTGPKGAPAAHKERFAEKVSRLVAAQLELRQIVEQNSELAAILKKGSTIKKGVDGGDGSDNEEKGADGDKNREGEEGEEGVTICNASDVVEAKNAPRTQRLLILLCVAAKRKPNTLPVEARVLDELKRGLACDALVDASAGGGVVFEELDGARADEHCAYAAPSGDSINEEYVIYASKPMPGATLGFLCAGRGEEDGARASQGGSSSRGKITLQRAKPDTESTSAPDSQSGGGTVPSYDAQEIGKWDGQTKDGVAELMAHSKLPLAVTGQSEHDLDRGIDGCEDNAVHTWHWISLEKKHIIGPGKYIVKFVHEGGSPLVVYCVAIHGDDEFLIEFDRDGDDGTLDNVKSSRSRNERGERGGDDEANEPSLFQAWLRRSRYPWPDEQIGAESSGGAAANKVKKGDKTDVLAGSGGGKAGERKRLVYANLWAPDDHAEVDVVKRTLSLGARRGISWFRSFKIAPFRRSVDVRLTHDCSLARGTSAALLGTGREVELLGVTDLTVTDDASSGGGAVAAAASLVVRAAPAPDAAVACVPESRLKRFMLFREKRIVYGRQGPVAWYELLVADDASITALKGSGSSSNSAEPPLRAIGWVASHGDDDITPRVAEVRHTFEKEMMDDTRPQQDAPDAGAAAAAASGRIGLTITEEMLNKSKMIKKLFPKLTEEESEIFLSFLTTPFLAVPLLLEFFADGRARALFDTELCLCLELALFQLHPYAPTDHDKERERWANITSTRDAELLGSRHGALLSEVLDATSGGAIFASVCRILHQAAQLADASTDVLLFAVRLACTIEEFAQCADDIAHAGDDGLGGNGEGGANKSKGGGKRRKSARSGGGGGPLASGDDSAKHASRDKLLSYLDVSASRRIRTLFANTNGNLAKQVELHAHLALIAGVRLGAVRAARVRAGAAVDVPLLQGYGRLVEDFAISSAFVVKWATQPVATSQIAQYPDVLRTVFTFVQANAVDIAQWSMHAPNAATCGRVLNHMKAVVVGHAPLPEPGTGSDDSETWRPASTRTVLCVKRISSTIPALADSDVFEAVVFPGAPYVSIAFDEDTKLAPEEVDGDRDHFK